MWKHGSKFDIFLLYSWLQWENTVRRIWLVIWQDFLTFVPSKKSDPREKWDKQLTIESNFGPKQFVWPQAIWQNWCFGQSYHSKIEKQSFSLFQFSRMKIVFLREQEKMFRAYAERTKQMEPILRAKVKWKLKKDAFDEK